MMNEHPYSDAIFFSGLSGAQVSQDQRTNGRTDRIVIIIWRQQKRSKGAILKWSGHIQCMSIMCFMIKALQFF